MVESTIEPKTIELQYVKNGVAELLVHWDIEPFEREGQPLFYYEECRMKWTLPYYMTTISEVGTYLTENENEILGWAKGSKVSL